MKLIIIGVVVLLLLGVGAGLALTGIVQVPGISPKNFGKPVLASDNPSSGLLWTLAKPLQDLTAKEDAAKKAVLSTASTADPSAAPKLQPELGDAKLAELWNDLPVDKLSLITAKWQAPMLAKVLLKMDPDQVTKLLAALDPKRADQLSRAVQTLASQPKPVEESSS